MINLWKPATIAAYCNQGRSGASLVDSGMFGRNATLQSAGSWSQIAGHRDRWALDLDGSQYGSVPSLSLGLSTQMALTITAWVCPDAYGSGPSLAVCGWRYATAGISLRISGASQIDVIASGPANTVRALPAAYVAESWHHLAARFTASSTELFWDGQRVGSPSSSYITAVPHASSQIRLWAAEYTAGTAASPFRGQGADLCFWPATLTDEEIAWLASSTNNVLQVPTGNRGFPLSRLVN